MMSFEPSVPLPLDPMPVAEADEKRLWIGNIDSRLTEYCLLKIIQQFGKIKRFDFLFHKSGALKGQPRGYSFVTYETREQAERALVALNGKTVLGKDLAVKWAHTAPSESICKKVEPLSVKKPTEEPKESKSATQQIKAIEQKLKAMQEQPDKELELCLSAVSSGEEDFAPLNKNTSLNRHKSRSEPYQRDGRKFSTRKR